MFFCPKCNNIFDITQSETQKGGGKYEQIVKKILSNKFTNKDELPDDLMASSDFKKLKSKQQNYVFNKIQDMLPKNIKKIMEYKDVKTKIVPALFKCSNCTYARKINEGTLIFEKSDTKKFVEDNSHMIHSDILPRTRKYNCPNEKCVSHNNLKIKEAIFFRNRNSYAINYICLVCKTQF